MPIPREVRSAYQRKIDDIIASVDKLSEAAVQRALKLAEETRQEILTRLLAIPGDSFEARHLKALRSAVDSAIADLVRRYSDEVAGLLERAHELGIDLAELPLKAAAVAAAGAAPVLPGGVVGRQMLEILANFSADLIQSIGFDARRKINGVLAQAALGNMHSTTAIKRIAGELPNRSVFSSVGSRASTIYRTEVGRVFSMSAQARMGQMNERLPGLKKEWVAYLDDRTRASHIAANGQIRPVDKPFNVGGHKAMFPRDPALPAEESANCRCLPGSTSVQVPGLVATFRRPYSGRWIKIRTADGYELAGTPNHPVLTTRGWVGLARLHVGDYVIRCGLNERVSLGDPDVQHVPAPIHEVFLAATETGERQRRAGRPMDFHGDGSDREVEVVGAVGLLTQDNQSPAFDPGGERLLVGTLQVPGALGRDGVSGVRSLGQPSTLSGGGTVHPDSHRLASVARLDPRANETSTYGGPVDIEAQRQFLLGDPARVEIDELGGHASISLGLPPLTGLAPTKQSGLGRGTQNTAVPQLGDETLDRDVVAARHVLGTLARDVRVDRVTEVSVGRFAGHVYNLQTATGWFVADGIVTHNCVHLPLLDDDVMADLGVTGRELGTPAPALAEGEAGDDLTGQPSPKADD